MLFVYLLKMIACSAAFYALYALLFSNEKMFVFNRFYLLVGLVASFIIPLIPFTVYITSDLESYSVSGALPVTKQYNWVHYVTVALTVVSMLGSVALMVRFAKNLLGLWRRTKSSCQRFVFRGATIVLLKEAVVPHSFMNTIFLNNNEYHSRHIEKEVLEHELAHVKQKHSWDILLVELLQIFCWFNPFIYLYKRSIKINHELLADAAVVRELDNKRSYQQILLHRAGAQPSLALASSFHFFTTKKRILMLQRKANPVVTGVKAAFSLPFVALLVFVFSERVYAQKDPKMDVITVSNVKQTSPPTKDVESTVVSYSKDRSGKQVKINYYGGKTIVEDISSPEKATAFEKKYGIELPPPPQQPRKSARKTSALPSDVDRIMVKQVNAKKSEAVISYKNGKKVSGDISTPEKQAAFEKKYGIKIPPPPPLPPTPQKNESAAPPPLPPVPAITVVKIPVPPAPKKAKVSTPPPPPKIVKKKVISFAPPIIVKDKKVHSFTPPRIVKDKKTVDEITVEEIPKIKKKLPSAIAGIKE